MSDIPAYNPNIRIPNLPVGRIVDENGYPTVEEQTFRQTLLTLLQNNLGDMGTVVTSLSQDNINRIVNNTQSMDVPGNSPILTYTCPFGTLFYNIDAPSMSNPGGYGLQVTVNNGSNIPVLKTVIIT